MEEYFMSNWHRILISHLVVVVEAFVVLGVGQVSGKALAAVSHKSFDALQKISDFDSLKIVWNRAAD